MFYRLRYRFSTWDILVTQKWVKGSDAGKADFWKAKNGFAPASSHTLCTRLAFVSILQVLRTLKRAFCARKADAAVLWKSSQLLDSPLSVLTANLCSCRYGWGTSKLSDVFVQKSRKLLYFDNTLQHSSLGNIDISQHRVPFKNPCKPLYFLQKSASERNVALFVFVLGIHALISSDSTGARYRVNKVLTWDCGTGWVICVSSKKSALDLVYNQGRFLCLVYSVAYFTKKAIVIAIITNRDNIRSSSIFSISSCVSVLFLVFLIAFPSVCAVFY